MHVDHEHAATALPEAHSGPRDRHVERLLHRRNGMGEFRARADDAVQPRPAGISPAGRKDQRAAGHACRPTSRPRDSIRTSTPRFCASCRRTSKPSASIQATAKIDLPVKLKVHDFDLRAAGQVGDAGHRQLSLRAEGCGALHQGCGAYRHRCVAGDVQLGAQAVRQTGRVAGRSGAVREIRQCGTDAPCGPSSAARALFAGAPNIERVDRLVQSIAAQQGMRNAVLDETVALVDARLEMNRKAAA